MDGICNDSKNLSGCTAESRDMVSNDSNERWVIDHSEEERQRKVSDTFNCVGTISPQNRTDQKPMRMYPTPNILIVDYTGFQLEQNFFIKELALYNPFAMTYWVGSFQKPFSKTVCKKKILDQIDAQTLHHGLSWDGGQYPYSLLPHFLKYFTCVHNLYATCAEKTNELQCLTDSPICHLNFEDSFAFGSHCPLHDATKFYCALDRAVRVGQCFANMYSFKSMH